MTTELTRQIKQQALRLPDVLPAVQALGVSGSMARGKMDSFSDVDICVFLDGAYPSQKARWRAYTSIGFTDPIYFDFDFGTSRGEGFRVEGMRCDFNWMEIEKVRAFLIELESDFDCPEWLPGGLATVKAIHDPQNVITQLQDRTPIYSSARSCHRVQQALGEIHFSLYGLGWLSKAAHREDAFSFLKYQTALFEKLFYALYALNRKWYSDEKRLTEHIMDFEAVPEKAGERIQAAILHTQDNHHLESCLHEIRALCTDTAQIARQRVIHTWIYH